MESEGPARTVSEFVALGNKVIPGDHFRLIYRFPARLRFGPCVQFRELEYPLGLGVGPGHILTAREQQAILETFNLHEFADRFGL